MRVIRPLTVFSEKFKQCLFEGNLKRYFVLQHARFEWWAFFQPVQPNNDRDDLTATWCRWNMFSWLMMVSSWFTMKDFLFIHTVVPHQLERKLKSSTFPINGRFSAGLSIPNQRPLYFRSSCPCYPPAWACTVTFFGWNNQNALSTEMGPNALIKP